MKKIKLIVLSAVALFALSSCEGVLNKSPLDIISDDTVWNDETLTEAYLVNCYYQCSFLCNESPGYGWSGDSWFYPFIINWISDECKLVWDGLGQYGYKTGGLKIGGGLLEWWGYSTIRKINEFIERVPNSQLPADLIKTRVAEARFLRAFSYFAMVKRYGGVPLITKAQELGDPEEELYPKRDKEAAVYDFIISECDAITNDLPDAVANDQLGRPSKYAALALKSRAALYAGSIAQFGKVQLDGVVGIPASEANKYYQASFDAAMAIKNSGRFQLYNGSADKVKNFRDIFLVENNSEVIFAKRHDSNNGLVEGGNGWAVDFMECPRPQGWSCGNTDGPYLEMVEEFEMVDGSSGKLDRQAIQQGLWTMKDLWGNRDPRFFASIYTQETPWQGGYVDYHYGLLRPDGEIQQSDSYEGVLCNGTQHPSYGTGFGILKYLDESKNNMEGTNSGWATSWQDFIIFRYAEILLNIAEAGVELGKTGEALSAINEIRTRAGIAPLASVDRDKVRHERKVELAFEGHRYWDVRRWRTAVKDLTRGFSGLRFAVDYNTFKDPDSPTKYKLMVVENIDGVSSQPYFREENYYFPITISRTSNNPNLVENPGYN